MIGNALPLDSFILIVQCRCQFFLLFFDEYYCIIALNFDLTLQLRYCASCIFESVFCVSLSAVLVSFCCAHNVHALPCFRLILRERLFLLVNECQ